MRVLELFCGIGGCAAAVAGRGEVVLAIDQDRAALATYAANHAHPVRVANLCGVKAPQLPDADLWWMSPPCQPYTVRGARRDLDDPRARSLVAVLGLVREVRPRYLALENVPGFVGSRAHALVRETLDALGYTVREVVLCPTSLGIPGARRRFYLVAGDTLRELPSLPSPPERIPTWPEGVRAVRPLSQHLGPWQDALEVPADLAARYEGALHVVDADDPDAVAACFTSAYGRSPVYAGSYLRQGGRLRRFAPEEIARLLGFPADFRLPAEDGWALVGNSLSVDAVRFVLGAI